MKFKLGCDPELFMADMEGKLRASCGLIGGTKYAPQPLPDLGDGFAIQEDNVAIEYNIPPAANAAEFVGSITKAMNFIGNGVKNGLGLQIVNLSAASFPKDQLEHPAAREFGCDPDYNAWTGKRNPKPKAADETLRSCGGHIHVGFEDFVPDKRRFIKCMDLYAGVPSVLMDRGELRKKLYGKRGAYREWVKGGVQGVEYRTLSNFWVFDPKLIDWAWRATENAIKAVESQFAVDEYDKAILDAIDNNNKEAATYLCKELNLEVLSSV